MMQEYMIIIEPTDTGYSAYAPDLPGCITVGDTVEETKAFMKEAVNLYIDTLKEKEMPIPPPSVLSDFIVV
ncbi:MAG: type II toxin-antitoxin system HicB family antitoxin [Tunicatimonas sp.]|uniref:type II toxin-antitoxin system HicB family antitoxin n=1 Tax=Tunicatimonas sp. TaxID=1940096 RepID=UPI003C755F6D